MRVNSLSTFIHLYIDKPAHVRSVSATSLTPVPVIGITCVYCCGLHSWPLLDVVHIQCWFFQYCHAGWVLLMCTFFLLLLLLAWRDPGFSISYPAWVSTSYYSGYNTITRSKISHTLSPSLESVPSLSFAEIEKCCHRPGPAKFGRVPAPNGCGDVSLNPDPGENSRQLGTVKARSMRDKAPALSDFITSNTISTFCTSQRHAWPQGNLSTYDRNDSSGCLLLPGNPEHRGVGLFVSSAHKSTKTSCQSISGTPECGQSCHNIPNISCPPGPATTFFRQL